MFYSYHLYRCVIHTTRRGVIHTTSRGVIHTTRIGVIHTTRIGVIHTTRIGGMLTHRVMSVFTTSGGAVLYYQCYILQQFIVCLLSFLTHNSSLCRPTLPHLSTDTLTTYHQYISVYFLINYHSLGNSSVLDHNSLMYLHQMRPYIPVSLCAILQGFLFSVIEEFPFVICRFVC